MEKIKQRNKDTFEYFLFLGVFIVAAFVLISFSEGNCYWISQANMFWVYLVVTFVVATLAYGFIYFHKKNIRK